MTFTLTSIYQHVLIKKNEKINKHFYSAICCVVQSHAYVSVLQLIVNYIEVEKVKVFKTRIE